MSPATSGPSQIAQLFWFWVLFWSQILDNGLTYFKTVYSFENDISGVSFVFRKLLIFLLLEPECYDYYEHLYGAYFSQNVLSVYIKVESNESLTV